MHWVALTNVLRSGRNVGLISSKYMYCQSGDFVIASLFYRSRVKEKATDIKKAHQASGNSHFCSRRWHKHPIAVGKHWYCSTLPNTDYIWIWRNGRGRSARNSKTSNTPKSELYAVSIYKDITYLHVAYIIMYFLNIFAFQEIVANEMRFERNHAEEMRQQTEIIRAILAIKEEKWAYEKSRSRYYNFILDFLSAYTY